jgi:aldose 1-epimerase
MDQQRVPAAGGFEETIDGKQIGLYIIQDTDGAQCAITNYGARIVSLLVHDRSGQLVDVALGYPRLSQYLQQPEEYMGAIVGRCANRIAGGLFVLCGNTEVLTINDNHNTLHGGEKGLHARVWTVADAGTSHIVLRYRALDGEEGFPGNLDIEVRYEWAEAGRLRMQYSAVTDRPTLVNISNHTYFNLNGEGDASVLNHELRIAATHITAVDSMLIPTGRLEAVTGGPFDFRQAKPIETSIAEDNAQLQSGTGYDHNFVLDPEDPTVTVYSPQTGIELHLTTDRPGMQFYSGNFLDGSRKGKSGRAYGYRSAFVLEPQGFPDAVHHPHFPSVVLQPDERYEAVSDYRFTAR